MNNCDRDFFRFWCYKVLPLVYDDSLSYYEILCKVVDYINNLIETDKVQNDEIAKLKQEVQTVQNWINNFDTSYAESIIAQYLATMIFVTISDEGYIIYTIPKNWESINFNTTGLDIENNIGVGDYDYGHLVLSY
jgi:hypothetical protein|uniref:MAD PROTEIN/MAX PROTEIN/DNA factor, DNA, bHLHZ, TRANSCRIPTION-DNA.0A n=1 Tax=Podoviridae sp. ctx9R1 TaxID=2826589 RepID=A0A8S5LWP3_9CAUD|nr:MAG TPA: MAD PROTEIN/MAX PROTEIN/DNA factor, DNA, bHLHZ, TRANSCRIPTION-DNA.0A [Podoviridae sp. ctx9R1]